MKICSFYSSVPELNSFDEQKLMVLWRERWAAEGWQPRILSEWQAMKHPLYANFSAAVSKLPSTNPAAYERAAFIRWLALAQVGGGYMTDYDVLPTSHFKTGWQSAFGRLLPPTSPNDALMEIWQTPCCPAFVYCSRELAEKFCRTIIDAQGKLGNAPQGNRDHYSDQYALAQLVDSKVDWIKTYDIVKLWSDKGWELASLNHFANAVMQPANKIPRWKHIPTLLQ